MCADEVLERGVMIGGWVSGTIMV